MEAEHFDRWTRRAAAPRSPRRSILALSGAALLGAASGPSVAAAGRCGQKCKKRCEKQVGACEDVVRAFCATEDPGGNGCIQNVLHCCFPLKNCDSATSTQCFIDNLFPPG
jgi:hypothetical protein